MTNKVSDPNIYRNCISYNGEPTPEGMVLAPIWITDEIFNSDCRIIRSNLITWKFCGCHFRIGFAPIKKESFADYMSKFFWPELNEEITKKRPGHCVIGTKPDGSPKLCPKTNLCMGCDKYGTLPCYNPKGDATVIESSYFFEDQEHDFEDTIHPQPDAHVMEEATKEELLEHLKNKNDRFAEIVELRLKGYELKEVFEALGLKQRQGYNTFKQAKIETKKLWNL